MTTDVRIAHQSFLVSAGKSTGLRATLPDALEESVVSWYVGGTLTDIDDLTGATEVEGTADGDDTVWTLPAVSVNTPVRMTVDDVPVTVGWLYPSELGATSVTSELTVSIEEASFTVEVGNIVTSGVTTVAEVDAVDGDIPAAPLAAALDVPLTIAAALWGASWSDFAGFAGWENLSSGLAYQGSSDQWVMVDADAETVTVTTAPAPGRLVVIERVLDLGNPLVDLGPGQAYVQSDGTLVAPGDESAPVYWPVVPARVAAVESDLADLTGEVDTLSGTVATLGNTVSGLADDVAAVEAAADVSALRDAVFGYGLANPYTGPYTVTSTAGLSEGHFECDTALPSLAAGVDVRALVFYPGGSPSDTWLEILTQTADEGAGAWDAFEIALWVDANRALRLYGEWTEVGGTAEVDNAEGQGPVQGVWMWVRKTIEPSTGTGAVWIATDAGAVATSDDTQWSQVASKTVGASTTILDSGEPWRIGLRGGLRIAKVDTYAGIDGTLVSSVDAANNTSSTVIPDSVLESAPETPAEWVAVGSATVVTP